MKRKCIMYHTHARRDHKNTAPYHTNMRIYFLSGEYTRVEGGGEGERGSQYVTERVKALILNYTNTRTQ